MKKSEVCRILEDYLRAQSRELGCQSFVLIIGDLTNQSNGKDSVVAEKFGAHFV